MPEYVEYSFSDDGEIFSDPTKIDNTIPNTSGAVEVKNFEINVNDMTTRYIKVFAKNIEKCPEWHTGAGGKAWIFVDEITVE